MLLHLVYGDHGIEKNIYQKLAIPKDFEDSSIYKS